MREDGVLPEEWEICDDREREHARDGDARPAQADEAARVQRPADGEVPPDGHDDRQPGAAQKEDIEYRLGVDLEVDRQYEVHTRE